MIYFKKSQPAPNCLNKNIDYRCGDVLERLSKDFKDKCYICEEKQPTTINIEHFIPHKENIQLKFNWDNLFFACGHCNNIKLDNYINILNCTKKEDEVETKIKYLIKSFPKIEVLIEVIKNDEKTINTAELLENIYDGKTENKRLQSKYKRNKLIKEINEFTDLTSKFEKNRSEEYLKNLIIEHLDSASAFTAFKRWIIRDNSRLYEDFKEFLK